MHPTAQWRCSMRHLLRHGSIARRRVLTAICSSVSVVLQLAAETVRSTSTVSDEEWEAFLRVHAASLKVIKGLQQRPTRLGRGVSLEPRLPTLALPRSDRFDTLVLLPDKFQQECGFSPVEFGAFLQEVEPVLHLCRDTGHVYGDALNRTRRAAQLVIVPPSSSIGAPLLVGAVHV